MARLATDDSALPKETFNGINTSNEHKINEHLAENSERDFEHCVPLDVDLSHDSVHQHTTPDTNTSDLKGFDSAKATVTLQAGDHGPFREQPCSAKGPEASDEDTNKPNASKEAGKLATDKNDTQIPHILDLSVPNFSLKDEGSASEASDGNNNVPAVSNHARKQAHDKDDTQVPHDAIATKAQKAAKGPKFTLLTVGEPNMHLPGSSVEAATQEPTGTDKPTPPRKKSRPSLTSQGFALSLTPSLLVIVTYMSPLLGLIAMWGKLWDTAPIALAIVMRVTIQVILIRDNYVRLPNVIPWEAKPELYANNQYWKFFDEVLLEKLLTIIAWALIYQYLVFAMRHGLVNRRLPLLPPIFLKADATKERLKNEKGKKEMLKHWDLRLFIECWDGTDLIFTLITSDGMVTF